MMKFLLAIVSFFCLATASFASDVLTDLATHVDSPVFVYLADGHSLAGTLASVDATGVTKLDNDDGTTTTHYDLASSSIVGFSVQTTDVPKH
jgi:hypothetical protein